MRWLMAYMYLPYMGRYLPRALLCPMAHMYARGVGNISPEIRPVNTALNGMALLCCSTVAGVDETCMP